MSAGHQKDHHHHQQQLNRLIKDMLRLNNEGVLRLVVKDEVAALGLFKQALAILPQYNVPNVATATDTGTDSSSPCFPFVLSSVPVSDLHDEMLHIYNQALIVDELMTEEGNTVQTTDGSIEAHIAGTIVIFNMALTVHMLGMKKHDEAKLRKACDIYELCANMVARTPALQSVVSQATGADINMQDNSNEEGRIAFLVLEILCLNNQAQIHHAFFDDYRYGGSTDPQRFARDATPRRALQLASRLYQMVTSLLAQQPQSSCALMDEIILNIHTIVSATYMASAAA